MNEQSEERMSHSRYYPYDRNVNCLVMRLPIGTTAKTGEKCPESGIWQVVGTPTTNAPIAKGNTIPPYSGKAVAWKLIQYA